MSRLDTHQTLHLVTGHWERSPGGFFCRKRRSESGYFCLNEDHALNIEPLSAPEFKTLLSIYTWENTQETGNSTFSIVVICHCVVGSQDPKYLVGWNVHHT